MIAQPSMATNPGSGTQATDLVKKAGTKSVVWVFFGLEVDKGGKAIDDGSARCHSCH